MRAILTSFLCPDSKILTQNPDSFKGVRSKLNDEDIVRFGNELNVRVFTFSLKKRASAVTKEHEDKSDVLSTIERTLVKL